MRPFGLYDLDHVKGDLVLRLGEEGEGYEGLGKPRVGLAGHYALSDEEGPIGNPSSDSRRTRIRADTRNALVLVYGPADDSHRRLGEVAELLTGAVGGTATTRIIRPGG
jgi:DNA/RNA-binding domain of Phe-tRNA-synthetase-like protein